jgi:hypothetical protein
MTSFPEIDYQKQLVVSGLDDFCPNAALPHLYGGQFGSTSDAWKRAVIDFLCINVRCGLIEATHRKELSTGGDVRRLKEILLNGDSDQLVDADVLWNALYFNATSKLIQILERLNLRSWEAVQLDVDAHFIAELDDLYAIE